MSKTRMGGLLRDRELFLYDQGMETVHDLLNGRIIVPPMEVEDVDIVSAKFLKTFVYSNTHVLDIVSDVVDLLRNRRVLNWKCTIDSREFISD